MKYKTMRSIVNFIMKFFTTIEIQGAEKLPQGNLIIASNHLGRLDSAALLCLIDREDIIMLIAEKYKYHPIFGIFGRVANGIWLDSSNGNFSALRQVLERMKQGGLLAISPEGTRSKTGAMQEAKSGVTFLASKSGYPILPVAITGTEDYEIKENLKRFRRSKIMLRVGDAFKVEIPKGKGREQALRAATDEIMCRIGTILPEKYRGVYAEHPRLKELLAEK